MKNEILKMTLAETVEAIQVKKIRAFEVAEAYLENSRALNPSINAYLTWNDDVLNDAKKVDEKIESKKEVGLLAGVPLALKDNYCTKGLRTTAASKILENFIPPYSATVVENLQRAGAVVLGKTNMDEFAMGSSNENSAFGLVRNPWNKDYVPGGSSGGSAAAVCGKMALGATGSDTGGSIRLPAHYCGIVGMKPTYGRISRYGIIAFASSLDQAGPMARTVLDTSMMLEAMCGYDPKDSTSVNQPVPKWSENLNSDLKGLKIGLPKEYFGTEGIHPDVQKTLDQAQDVLRKRGAMFVDVDLPLTEQSISVYYLVATCEASSNLARYDGVRFGPRVPAANLDDMYKKTRGQGFGPEVKRRIMIGTYALSAGYYDAYYVKACQVRRLIQDDFKKAFQKCDVIFGPVSTAPAFRIGDRISDPLRMYLNDIFTTSVNLAGLPGLSVPAGFDQSGLPIGVQFIGPHFSEQKILNAALSIEEDLQAWKGVSYGN